jgi:hypothetical protein
VAETRLRDQGLLDPARVRACWAEHVNGRRDRAHELWALLMFEAWLDYQDGSAGTSLPQAKAKPPLGFLAAMEHPHGGSLATAASWSGGCKAPNQAEECT